MSLLMNSTARLFNLADDKTGEFSIEIHPGRVSIETMHHLRQLGFNRVSMGVQDFDLDVQKAVNRYNSFQEISELVDALKRDQYRSISMDLIYGLPKQTISGFQQTLHKIIDLSPDRLSIFNYAHMPHLFKSQALIRTEDLPDAATKMDILHMTIETLEAAGYIYIGMDHFAKPDDDLVIAQNQGKLHRNFQGYSTHSNCDLLALGVSSISMIDNIYIQNVKDLQNYQIKIDAGLLPIAKGFTLNEEDRLRRFVINQLICQLRLDYCDIENFFGIDATTHFRYQIQELELMQKDGLLSLSEKGIEVTNAGRLLIRRICMVFDEYLPENNLIRYSKII
jgi:oxygen-independent coproporphyrinogen-3 oxidase